MDSLLREQERWYELGVNPGIGPDEEWERKADRHQIREGFKAVRGLEAEVAALNSQLANVQKILTSMRAELDGVKLVDSILQLAKWSVIMYALFRLATYALPWLKK